uniref:Cyclin N-terminal domain-containing protein n=1 Tax=Parascaris univalens TaxID=6257 RepID=A0A915B0X3_PARUN
MNESLSNQQATSTQDEALQRRMPTQMRDSANCDSEEMWRLMCTKSKIYARSSHMLDNHPEILVSMRTILFDWMMDVCQAERLHRETFYMSMEYVDRFMSNTKNLPSSKLQLFGTVAIHIACKFEEVYPPKLKTLVSYTDGACRADEVRDAERIMLKFLSWLLNPLTAVHWLGVYLVLLGRVDNENADTKQWRIAETGADNAKMYNLLCESSYDFSKVMRTTFISMAQVLDLCMLDPRSIRFDYAELAAAVLWCFFAPNELIEEITGFQMEQLHSVCRFVEPYTYVWERRRPPGQPLPVFEGVDARDFHNIQTHIDDYESLMAEADDIRAEMSHTNELRQKRMNMAPVTLSSAPCVSPKPLSELQNTSGGSSQE